MRTVSLPAALYGRAAQTLGCIVAREHRPGWEYGLGHWSGWNLERDGLKGVLESPDSLRFTRPQDGHDNAALRMVNLRMTSVEEEKRSDPTAIRTNVVERFRQIVHFAKPVKETQVVSHTFSRTVSEAEAAKKAWEVAAKAALSVEYAGIKGSLEVSGKYGEELSRQVSASETRSDTESKTLEIQGPIDLEYEAYRSLDRERRAVTARCDFDFDLYLDPGPDFPGGFGWRSFRTSFLPVVKRIAPETECGYLPFMDLPMSDAGIAALEAPSDKLVEFLVEYDNVQTQHINVL